MACWTVQKNETENHRAAPPPQRCLWPIRQVWNGLCWLRHCAPHSAPLGQLRRVSSGSNDHPRSRAQPCSPARCAGPSRAHRRVTCVLVTRPRGRPRSRATKLRRWRTRSRSRPELASRTRRGNSRDVALGGRRSRSMIAGRSPPATRGVRVEDTARAGDDDDDSPFGSTAHICTNRWHHHRGVALRRGQPMRRDS